MEAPQIVTQQRKVPNQFPIKPGGKIALIGDAPGVDEETYNIPFVGKAGAFLDAILRQVNIDRSQCFVGHICQYRLLGNRFVWDSPQVQDGLSVLYEDLYRFNPTVCVLFGSIPLQAAKGHNNIDAWRGSIFKSNVVGPFYQRKCVATYHPSFVLREYKNFPLLQFDLQRAANESKTHELNLPQRQLITNLPAAELCFIFDNWPAGKQISIDIEGGLPVDMVHPQAIAKRTKQERQTRYNWPCVGFCASPDKAYAIPWLHYTPSDAVRIMKSFARLMYRSDVPKVLQNQLYDNFVLSYGYGIPIVNVAEDVMIKSWEIYAELPRALSVQASVWTKEPHWKDDSMYLDRGEGLYRGCALDTAVTLEISLAQDNALSEQSKIHYYKTIELQKPFLYMELRGIKYNTANAKNHLDKVQAELDALGQQLEEEAGCSLRGPKGSLSAKKLTECLYVIKKYPPQYKKENGRRTEKLTSDKEALLRLGRGRENDDFLRAILQHRYLESIKETLQITADDDGRVRCGYSLEAETGRVRCYASPTGSGANLQTIQKQLRNNYVADTGYSFFQCDLEGADGWTVAAHCKRLGDSTMFDDYKAGMKPAKLIALMYIFGTDINKLSRPDLKYLHDRVFPLVLKAVGKWLYLGSKRVQHGSNYLMGIPTMQQNVLQDSYKESGTPVYMSAADARKLQECYFARYPGVAFWHTWAKAKLVADAKLTSASGNTRIFFGRRYGPDLHNTVKEFLAHEPQNNTTWVTNLAMLNLWQDPANRVANVQGYLVTTHSGEQHLITGITRQLKPGSLLVEPLHQVHDALCGQWPTCITTWARNKIKQWFNNTITIAGIPVNIPFDGEYGPSWGKLQHRI